MNNSFKQTHSYEKRCEMSNNILHKYNNKFIPLVLNIEKSISKNDTNIIKIICKSNKTVNDIINLIRTKYTKITSTESVFIFTDTNVFIKPNDIIIEVYNNFKDTDNILYFNIVKENTFG